MSSKSRFTSGLHQLWRTPVIKACERWHLSQARNKFSVLDSQGKAYTGPLCSQFSSKYWWRGISYIGVYEITADTGINMETYIEDIHQNVSDQLLTLGGVHNILILNQQNQPYSLYIICEFFLIPTFKVVIFTC